MTEGKVKELIEKYEEIRARKERLKNEKTQAEEDYKLIQIELAAAITEIGEDSVKAGGYLYTPSVTTHYNMKSKEALAESKVDKFEVLRENGFDYLISETINSKSFGSAMKELADSENGIPEELMVLINPSEEITVSRTKKSASKQEKIAAALERRKANV